MGHLVLSLLGAAEVRHGDRAVVPPTRKALALLAYLATQPGAHQREALAALLWPDADRERGRGALRRTLALLRQALAPGNPHLVARRETLELDPEDVELDAALLATAAGPHVALTDLLAVCAAWRGEFLAGLSIEGAAEFDEWLAARREALRESMRGVWERGSRRQFDEGAFAEAVRTTTQWLAHEPLEERAYQRLMQAHLGLGDRASALLAYERCRAILREELDVLPAVETESLARSARATEREPAEPSPGGVAFVGRRADRALLASAYRRAAAGRPQLVVLEGEPGIGKTRLATEFAGWARAAGGRVVAVRALEVGADLPYQPVADASRQVLDELGPSGLPSRIWLAELTRLVPDIAARVGDLPEAPQLEPALARARLFEAVARLTLRLAEVAPLVLLVDDAQWIAPDTLAVLDYCARQWAQARARLLLVLSVRSGELPSERSPRALAEALESLSHELGPLDPVETAALVLAASETRPLDARELHARTAGNPLFVLETLRFLSEHGGAVELPPRIRDVIAARLDRLVPVSRETLLAVAVLGERCGLGTIARTVEAGEAEVVRALEDLTRRRLLNEAGGRYAFTHQRIRDVAHDEASDARRRVLHRRAFAALAAEGGAPAELLRHAVAGDLPEGVRELSLAAGDDAYGVCAMREAIEHYERVRRLAGELDEERLLRLCERLGRAYEVMGDPQAARAVYGELLRLGRARMRPKVEVVALQRLATVELNSERPDGASAYVEAALALERRVSDPIGEAESRLLLGDLHLQRRDLDAAWHVLTEALERARPLGTSDLVARCLNRLGYVLALQQRWYELARRGSEAVAACRACADPVLEADSLSLLARAEVMLGSYELAARSASRALDLSAALENPWGAANAAKELAVALLDGGDLAAASAAAERGVLAAKRSSYPPLVVLCLGVQGMIARRAGELERANALHSESAAVAGSLPPSPFTDFARELAASELCADFVAAGDWARAAERAREAMRARRMDQPFAVFTRPEEVEALLRDSDVALAADVSDLAAAAAGSPRLVIPHRRALAALARWRGEAGVARQHLAHALEVARGLGLRSEIELIKAELGRARRRPARARLSQR